VKEVLSQHNVKYAYIDICESVGSLKKFLNIRDVAPEYEEVRQTHRAGIPMIVIDDKVILINGAEHMENLIKEYNLCEE
jgi:glutaredoxin-related protein